MSESSYIKKIVRNGNWVSYFFHSNPSEELERKKKPFFKTPEERKEYKAFMKEFRREVKNNLNRIE